MTLIKDVSETYALPVARLRERGVVTVAELWAAIGKDVDKGLDKVVERTRDPAVAQPDPAADRQIEAALLAFLIADALEESIVSPKRPLLRVQAMWRKLDRLWPDLLAFGLLLLIIGLGIRAMLFEQKVVQRVAVKPGATLPSFTMLDAGQLMMIHVFDQPGTFATIDELKPRYAAANLSSGTLVKEEQLLPAGLSPALVGRQLVTLPIKNDIGKVAKPMERVQLMIAPHDKEKPGLLIRDAILLSTTKTGESASVVVAVTGNDAKSMAPLLGLSDVFVSQTLP